MLDGSRVAVVVPCYEVSSHIAAVLRAIPSVVDSIIVVNDGSRDGLEHEIERLRAEDPYLAARLVVRTNAENQGLARAMETGLATALGLGADFIVKMDGDGQMDPALLPALLAPLVRQEADFAKGNRFMHRRDLRGMPRQRLAGNLVLSFLAKAASGYWQTFDPTNGYLALRKELVGAVDLGRLGPGYFFELSLLIEAYLAGAVLVDVTMPARYGEETSQLSLWRTLMQFPWRLVRGGARRIVLRYFLRDFTPVAVFLLSGVALFGFGLVFGLYHWLHNLGSGMPTPTGTIIVAVLPLLMGFQLLLQAVVMDIGNVPRRSPWRNQQPRDDRP